MNFSRIILLFSLCFIINLDATSQKRVKNRSDVEVIDFGKKETVTIKNNPIILKTSPMTPLVGKALIEAERLFFDYMSIQIGLGVTYKPLLDLNSISILELESQDFNVSPIWDNDIYDDFNDYTTRKSSPGFLISISPRFFFESDGFEGSYIAPVIRYSTFNYKAQSILETRGIVTFQPNYDVDEVVKRTDFIVHYGHQTLYPKLSAEYFIGLGARKVSAIRQDLGIDAFGTNRNGISEYKSTSFLLEAGIRIGFQL